jgi:hypothetical protein
MMNNEVKVVLGRDFDRQFEAAQNALKQELINALGAG